MWTKFWDMHSGGSNKIKTYDKIYIEAPIAKAERIFQHRFNRNPYNVTCNCCGEDFSVYEYESLEKATKHHRKSENVKTYFESESVCKISKSDFTDVERNL